MFSRCDKRGVFALSMLAVIWLSMATPALAVGLDDVPTENAFSNGLKTFIEGAVVPAAFAGVTIGLIWGIGVAAVQQDPSRAVKPLVCAGIAGIVLAAAATAGFNILGVFGVEGAAIL